MKVAFLGTNGWYDTPTGNTLCVLIDTRDEYIVLDAGLGISKIDKYIKEKKPVYLFLSHFHLDHIYGMHVLVKFVFKQGMDIYGPPGAPKILWNILKKPYTVPLSGLHTKVRIFDITKKQPKGLKVEFLKLRHSAFCFGYRFVLEGGKVISFCTDTGDCPNLVKLARNADMFITECTFKKGQKNDEWPHLNPETAAKVAKEAGVKNLALVHFDGSLYGNLYERESAEKTARGLFRDSFVTYDNQEVIL